MNFMDYCFGSLTHNKVAGTNIFTQDYKQKKHRIQAVGALGELSDKSDFSLLAWDNFSQEICDPLLFYCQKSLNLHQMQ